MDWCTTQCKMLLFCVKIIVKESCKFELEEEKEGKEEEKKKKKKKNNNNNILAVWRLSGSVHAF